MSLTIAVDVDEVVADLIGRWLALYNLDYDDNLTSDDIDRWEIDECVKPSCGTKIREYLFRSDLYDHVLPVKLARNGVYQLLADGHRVVYASSCPSGTEAQKADWLVRWGFTTKGRVGKDFIPCSDKSLIHADFLFDDGVHNLEGFSGRAILVRRPHNIKHHTEWPSVAGMESAPHIVRGFTQVI